MLLWVCDMTEDVKIYGSCSTFFKYLFNDDTRSQSPVGNFISGVTS